MTTRSRGPAAGFGWLTRGISVPFKHPKPLFAGAAILMLLCLLPSLITFPMQLHAVSAGTPLSPAFFGWIAVISTLLGLLLVPLYAGYLQVVDAAERGLPARAREIFRPYRNGEAVRLIGYGLALLVIYAAVVGIAVVATGGGIATWYMQSLTAQASHLPPPALPHYFGLAITLFMVFGLFMMGFYAISLGQISLNHRNVFGAIGDGFIGALKNVLPLLVFALISILAWIAVAIVIAIVVVLLVFIGKLVGTWLVFVLIIPLYIALILAIFGVMFGVMYQLWRDVCGDDIVTTMPPPLAA
jgi:hypothetical protein